MKNQRRLLVLALCIPVFYSCDSGPIEEVETEMTNRPNIIFIMVDDLGYADLGCYGQQLIKTPHIDQMAAEGMKFTQCYAGSPVCAPSRSVLMTGQHTGHTTVRGNFGNGGVVGLGGRPGRIPLQDRDTTIAEVLKAAGYVTGMAGKWGLGEPNTTGEPNQQGFDEFFGFLNQRRAHSYYVPFLWHNTERIELDENKDGATGTYVHDLFADFALDFIEVHQDTAFFLYLPYTIPHSKYEVPDLGIYADSSHWEENERIVAAMISRMDADIGRMMTLLKELELDENTAVFFCSDNGAAERWEGRFNSSGLLRGRKRDLYEGGIRTPMIVRYPGKIEAGTTNDLPWHFMDVMPTLAAMGGGKVPSDIDGRDISSAFWNGNDAWRSPETILYWEFYERDFQQAVRWKDWKGIKLQVDQPWELYDLSKDPAERLNIAADHPEVVREIAAIAHREHAVSEFYPKKRPAKD